MIDNWHNRQQSSLISTDILINMTYIKDDKKNNLRILKTTLTEKKEYMHIVQEKDDTIDIKREKCIIKKGIVRKEIKRIEREDNSSSMKVIQNKLDMIDIEREKCIIMKDEFTLMNRHNTF